MPIILSMATASPASFLSGAIASSSFRPVFSGESPDARFQFAPSFAFPLDGVIGWRTGLWNTGGTPLQVLEAFQENNKARMTANMGRSGLSQLIHRVQERLPVAKSEGECTDLIRRALDHPKCQYQGKDAIILQERLLTEKPATLEELAQKFGVNRERFRTLEQKLVGRIVEAVLREASSSITEQEALLHRSLREWIERIDLSDPRLSSLERWVRTFQEHEEIVGGFIRRTEKLLSSIGQSQPNKSVTVWYLAFYNLCLQNPSLPSPQRRRMREAMARETRNVTNDHAIDATHDIFELIYREGVHPEDRTYFLESFEKNLLSPSWDIRKPAFRVVYPLLLSELGMMSRESRERLIDAWVGCLMRDALEGHVNLREYLGDWEGTTKLKSLVGSLKRSALSLRSRRSADREEAVSRLRIYLPLLPRPLDPELAAYADNRGT